MQSFRDPSWWRPFRLQHGATKVSLGITSFLEAIRWKRGYTQEEFAGHPEVVLISSSYVPLARTWSHDSLDCKEDQEVECRGRPREGKKLVWVKARLVLSLFLWTEMIIISSVGKKEAEHSFWSGRCNLIFSHPVTKGVATKMDVEMTLHVVSSCRQTVVVPCGRLSLFFLKKKWAPKLLVLIKKKIQILKLFNYFFSHLWFFFHSSSHL